MLLHPSYHAEKRPDHPAYIMASSGEIVTYQQLNSRSNQGAQLFRHLGLKRGDHIAILMENNARFFEIVWAAQRAGLYFTPISYYLKTHEIEYIVKDCGAKVFITSEKQLDKVFEIKESIPSLLASFFVDGASIDDSTLDFKSWESTIQTFSDQPIEDESEGREMLYSSGTTGNPKGIKVPLAEGEIGKTQDVVTGGMFSQFLGVTEDTVFLSTSPLYHSAPFGYNMNNLRMGATSVIMEKFDAEQSLQLIEKYGISLSQWVPTMFTRLLKLPAATRKKYDLTSLTCAIHGAAPCAVSVKESMIDWWGPVLIEFYSGSERNGIFMITSEDWLAHKGSVGKCIDAQVHIVDEKKGKEVATGEVGSIYCSSDRSFEYHNSPEKTASTQNKDGWTTIGDLGYVDEEGFLYLTDRKDYMIISGGVNVYPQEIEDTLISHPRVYDIAVFGIPDEDLGEKVHAVVQLTNPEEANPQVEEMLISYCKERLSTIKCPKSIHFAEQLPREDTGKLKKRLIKDIYWDDSISPEQRAKELGLMSNSSTTNTEKNKKKTVTKASKATTKAPAKAKAKAPAKATTAKTKAPAKKKATTTKLSTKAENTALEKLLDGNQIMMNLHNEHRYMCKLLDVFYEQLDVLDQGLTPDYNIMNDVMSYMYNISEKSHHPREDIVYRKLLELDSKSRADIEALFLQHETMAIKTAKLIDSLKNVIKEETIENIESVKFHCEDYLTVLQEHMSKEERIIFPRIAEVFTEKDWDDIIAEVQPEHDPLFGVNVDRRYQNLNQYLTNRMERAAEDITLMGFFGLSALTEGIGSFSTGFSAIREVVRKKSKKAIEADKAAYRRLWKAPNTTTKDYIGLAVDCTLDGLDTCTDVLSEVSTILRRTRAQISEPYNTRVELYNDVTYRKDSDRRKTKT